jgi:hypothetical protein
LGEVVNMTSAGTLVTDKQFHALRVALVLLVPVAWATGYVQADDRNILSAAKKLEEMKIQLDSIAAINYEPRLAQTMRDASIKMKVAVGKRCKGHLVNELAAILDALDPQTEDKMPEALPPARLVEYIKLFWADRNVDVAVENDIAAPLMTFANRTASERRMTRDDYWAREKISAPKISEFVREISGVVASEAGAERAFQRHAIVVDAQRTLISDDAANSQIFVSLNSEKISLRPGDCPTQKKWQKNAPHIMSKEEWNQLCMLLQEPGAEEGVLTRHAHQFEIAKTLGWGDVVSVQFIVENPVGARDETWYEGVILHQAAGFCIYHISWKVRTDKKLTDTFAPLGKDKNWKLISRSGS